MTRDSVSQPTTRTRGGLTRAFQEYVLPMIRRPRLLQTSALCYRDVDGVRQVLLITSRDTGRWVIPKGWTMRGMDAGKAASIEAWEEAGVRCAQPPDTPLGCYHYKKIKGSGLPVDVEVLVYPLEVDRLEDTYPEVTQRERRWVTPGEAAQMVREPMLQDILRAFG